MIHIDLPAKSVSLVLLLFAFSILPAIPQDQCGFRSEESANKLEASLHNAPSCKAAAKLFDECRWGSSADVSFGAIVAEKCKREYLNKLTPAQKKVHDERIELCNYQYEHQEGTLAISETTSATSMWPWILLRMLLRPQLPYPAPVLTALMPLRRWKRSSVPIRRSGVPT